MTLWEKREDEISKNGNVPVRGIPCQILGKGKRNQHHPYTNPPGLHLSYPFSTRPSLNSVLDCNILSQDPLTLLHISLCVYLINVWTHLIVSFMQRCRGTGSSLGYHYFSSTSGGELPLRTFANERLDK